MMILGPTESLVIADDIADPRLRRRRPAQRGRARHRLGGAAGHHVGRARRRGRPRAASAARRLCPRPAPRRPAPRSGQRWLRVVADLARRGRRRRQPLGARAPAGRRRPRCRGRSCSTAWSTPARSSSASTPCSAAGNFVIGCPASLPTGGFAHVSSGITADAFLKRTAVARADATALPADVADDPGDEPPRRLPGHANAARSGATDRVGCHRSRKGRSLGCCILFHTLHRAGTPSIRGHRFRRHRRRDWPVAR